MKKTLKLLVLFLIGVVFAFGFASCSDGGSSSGGSEDDYYTEEADETIILHAQNYNNIFIWESGISELDETQNEMTAETDGWYRFEIESNSAGFLFFTDNWESKTEDLHAIAGEWWYYGNKLNNCAPDTILSLPAPKNLSAEADGASIYVSWDSVDFAEVYSLYYAESPDSASACFLDYTQETYMPIDAYESGTYYFWVKAKNYQTESEFSNVAYCTATVTDSDGDSQQNNIPAPTSLTATAQSTNEVVLSWNTSFGVSSYRIYYGTNSNSADAQVYANATTTRYTVSSLNANTLYYFWVKAVTSDGTESEFSNPANARTSSNSSSGGNQGGLGGSPVTNDLLSDVKNLDIFTKPTIKPHPTLTDNKKGFYITLNNSSDMNANYYILYRSTTSKTDLSAYKKIKTVSKSSNIAFEDFDISFSKNSTYYYIVVAVNSKDDAIGTMSLNGMEVVLGAARVKYCTTADLTKNDVNRYVKVDGSDTVDKISYHKNGSKTYTKSLEPGIHSIKWCRTLNGTYMNIVSNYNFLAGCEYSITFETSKMSSSSPTLSTSSSGGFSPPSL